MDRHTLSAHWPWFRMLGALLLLAGCGCADVRVVRETPIGGVIALPMNSDCWPMYYRSRAEKMMSAKCPDGYRIDKEEVVWNGKEGPEGHRYHDSYFGYTDPDDEMAPYLRKEYRISFHAAPAGRGQPASPSAPSTGKADTSLPLPSAPGNRAQDELPPPRPLK